MSKKKDSIVQFSGQFISQLGSQLWQENPHFFRRPAPSQSQQTFDENDNDSERAAPESVSVGEPKGLKTQLSVPEGFCKTSENTKVFIANNVDEIWQNEAQLSWRLWENIQCALEWQESQVHFFNASTMTSEDSYLACVDEIMLLSVDQVFVMLDDHPVIDMLQEGVEVVRIPSLDEMLEDPYAKQQFYQTLMRYQ